MASEKTLNAKNLAALGAERLAELLLELATGDAAAKRRLRLELASRSGGGDVAAEIRKRLAAIARSKSFVDWRKIRPLAQDLDMQRAAIMDHVAPTKPAEAFDLLWRLLEMAPSIYERCDDSNGTIGNVVAIALEDLGTVAGHAALVPARLSERVFAGVCANDYGQFDGLIALMAKPLGREGLETLKALFEKLAAKAPPGERRVIGYGMGGPLYKDDYLARNHARTVQSALTEIADALGDVDGYIARFSPEERANPAIAARIAERLLAADRAAEAMTALTGAEAEFRSGRHWPDWQRVRIDALDALGRSDDAQSERWAIFERTLNAEYLRAYITRLPDFDDEEAENRALAYVGQFPIFSQALAFLIDWPAHDLAAKLILARHAELDGNHYELLTPAADALEQRHPLAATLMLRAMIDFSLINARYKRYGHAARHLQTCAHLAKRIEDFGDHPDHDAYAAHLKQVHGRKTGFWNA
ncbi:DUF6880 family protein [Novosphingobium sp. Fuku2-ISO-50]|uniref:DUF6880 family protein n=1 Tax=Novosphingobium sp. Fuku2-ISO-50 TaxID=1739114 RepID=UPI00076CC029|nr:DUF6880 family protein [Novosphingobium sp. Fuku2-ISO-50]KUR75371.1 hypothetical protein AQZ50_16080 [Novosphingobium sp. Fuku2-ISO-50]